MSIDLQLELNQLEQQQAVQDAAAHEVPAGVSEEERFVQEMLSDGLTPEQGKAQAQALAECFEQVAEPTPALHSLNC